MHPVLTRLRLFCLTGLAALLLGLPAHVAAQAQKVDRIIAVVNDEVITSLQLRNRLEQAIHQLQRQGVELPPQQVLEQQLLERLIVERAQLQLAAETGIEVDEGTLTRAIERIAGNNGLSTDELRATLAEDGISWNRFRNEIRTEIILTRLREREVDSRIAVSEAEIDNFLANNPDAFSGEEFEVSHILLRVPEQATQDDLERLRVRAEQIMARLRSGDDFARVAAEVSDAPDGLSGGSLGWRTLDRLPALFVEVVRDMRPGETSPLLRSGSGLHIVRLVDRRGGGQHAAAELEQTHARHILVRTSEVVSDADAEARLRAILERIVNGADFAELAKANSADGSAAKGGDLGWLNPGDTVPEFQRAMDALQPGEVSAPVQSPFGWHIIQVLERRIRDVSTERLRNAARTALRERKIEEGYEDWLRQLRDSTYVDLRLDRE